MLTLQHMIIYPKTNKKQLLKQLPKCWG